MAPAPQRDARYPGRSIVQRGPTSPLLRRATPQPPITYGKKAKRLLSLTGDQFRSDIFDIPFDDEEDSDLREDGTEALLEATNEDERTQDSMLPNAFQPTRVVTRAGNDDHGNKRSPGRGFVTLNEDRAGPRRAVTSTANNKKSTAKPVRTPRKQPTNLLGERDKTGATIRPTSKKAAKGAVSTTAKRKTSKAKSTTPARRLPVNELFLVNSPQDVDKHEDPRSTYHGIHTQDPIQNTSSSPRKRRSSSSSLGREQRRDKSLRRSLTGLRTLFRPTLIRPKKLRSYLTADAGDDDAMGAQVELRGCDGFDRSEIAVKPQVTKLKRRQSQNERLICGFRALHFQKGPLPDVEFKPVTGELIMSTEYERDNEPHPEHAEYEDASLPIVTPPKRKNSFSDYMREDRIRAELSSVSALQRKPSQSDESDHEEGGHDNEKEHVHDELSDSDEEDLPVNYDVNNSDLLGHKHVSTKPSSVELTDSRTAKQLKVDVSNEPVERPKRTNTGVTLDFRQPLVPGQLPRQSLRRQSLVEVKEAIIEVPDSPTPLHREPITGGVTRISSRRRIEQPDEQVPMRRRSILRNSTPAIPDSTTLVEHTQANTRRNSLIDVDEDRYFTTATNMLGVAHPTRHTIIPRRGSALFNEKIEVPFTGRAVPETSPEPPTLPYATQICHRKTAI